ncbi:beta-mannosidase [Aplysia californica]|uniref:Beta-mannosidase n=1 Tax=Aplysia californica TaxID=6500 RepID=A0ABM1A4K1_APLCA|nr:beta-mannosidase [Aplysia californica]
MFWFHVTVLIAAGISERMLTPHNFVNSYERVSLDGQFNWILSEESSGVSVAASVPGCMYSALLRKKLIQDPLYRDNDVHYVWMGNADWTYSRNFTVSKAVAGSSKVLLVCEGLDTVTSVVVNGKSVGSADNMFVRYTYDVTGIVTEGENRIVVGFHSAVREAATRAQRSSYVIPPNCPPQVQNGQCHVNQMRKEQCSFSWDWGPSFPTQGIWKPIYLDAFSTAIIRQVSAIPKKVSGQWQVDVDVICDVSGGTTVKGQVRVELPGLNLTLTQQVTVSAAQSRVKVVLKVPLVGDPHARDVLLWWPNGYGHQNLYLTNVTFTSGSDVSSREVKVGFRTVELIQDPVSSDTSKGLSFYFRINGLPVFLKGSNWIPADSFQDRITRDKLSFLLRSTAAVGINSMRVWGGGVYESEDFYELCDELGIMVWQDLMFSVALYPTYDAFLKSVATEIRQQIQRLKHHPSIILWAGNNENEKGLRQNWFKTQENYTLYYNDYVKLYVTTIKPIVNGEDDSREYAVSSPSNGKESEKEGYVAKDPGSELYGDIHYYDYAADQWDPTVFRIPRMASEYGIQAWCNNESLSGVFAPGDFAMDAPMVSHRQHHGHGNIEMAAEVGMHMDMSSSKDPAVKFADFTYLTQINQAMSMRTQTEHYRRFQSRLLYDGRGLTMGALYWQLNDIWQAPTWASIDYEGRWKMLHYYARHFFQPTLVSPYLRTTASLDVYMVVDQIPTVERRDENKGELRFEPMTDVEDLRRSSIPPQDVASTQAAVDRATTGRLTLTMYTYASFSPLKSWTVDYSMNTTAESVYTASVSQLLSEANCMSRENCFLHFSTTDKSNAVTSTSWLFLSYPKDAHLAPAHIKVSAVRTISPRVFEVDFSSDAVALFVWLSVGDIPGWFSDNGFLLHTPTTTVQFYADTDVTAAKLQATLRVKSLSDI